MRARRGAAACCRVWLAWPQLPQYCLLPQWRPSARWRRRRLTSIG